MKKLFNKFKENRITNDIILILILLVIFSGVFLYWGNLKSVNFCDEIYTYILSNSRNEFLAFQLEGGRWYENGEIQNILSANDGFQFKQVMLNNKGDVHPPMYYFVFHILSVLNSGSISKWIGLAANWIFAVLSLLAIYALIKSVTKSKMWSMAACLVYISSPAVISNNMFFRMYAMFSMWVLLFVYVSYRLYTDDRKFKEKAGWYIALSAVTFFGFLTQYYFAVFCVLFTCFYCLYRLLKKQWKEILCYLGSLVLAVAGATVFWRTWIRHMFSGYLGGAVKENAFNFAKVFDSIKYGFVHLFTLMYNHLGVLAGIIILVLMIFMLVKKDKRVKYVFALIATAVLYSISIVHLTPTHLLSYRYFFPVVGIAYLALILGVYYTVEDLWKHKVNYGAGIVMILVMLNFVRPLYDKDAVMYVDAKGTYAESMAVLEDIKDVPWVYYGYENATMTELFYDAAMAEHFIMVNAAAPFVDETYTKNNCEFILFAGSENSYFGEDVYTSMEQWFEGTLEYEELTHKGYMTVYKVTHSVNSGE